MVFISYSSVEYATALQIHSALESNGIDCWMAPESIPPGSDYADEIQGAIEGSDIFLLVLSESSQKSKWVRKELDKALSFDKIIIPIHIDESSIIRAFDYRLTDVQRIEAFGHLSVAISKAIARILSLQQYGKKTDVDPSDNDEEMELPDESIVAYNKARRIRIAKSIALFFLGFLVVSSVMFGVNILIRGFINNLLNSWFYADGNETIQDFSSTNPITLIVLGMWFLLPVAWIFFKGINIDSPTLKILGALLIIIETCILHLLPRLVISLIGIILILVFLYGMLSGD